MRIKMALISLGHICLPMNNEKKIAGEILTLSITK